MVRRDALVKFLVMIGFSLYLLGVKRLLESGETNAMALALLTALISVFLFFEMFNAFVGFIASYFAAFSFGNNLRLVKIIFPSIIQYFITFCFNKFEVFYRLAGNRFCLLSVLLVALHFLIMSHFMIPIFLCDGCVLILNPYDNLMPISYFSYHKVAD